MELTALYPSYFGALTGYCMKMTGDRPAAEDIAQEAFIRAWGQGEAFAELSAPQQRAWLNRTARRIFIDQMRRRARAPFCPVPEAEEPDLTALPVQQALATLDPALQRLFSLRHFAGFTSAEIGRQLDMPPATVRTRLRAAAKQLRAYYFEGGTNDG